MQRITATLVACALLGGSASLEALAAEENRPQQTQDVQMSDPKALLAQFGAKIFGEKDFTVLGGLMREDYIQHNPLVGQGSKGFKDFFEAWFKASPDFKFELKQIVSEGDKVWVYGTYSGTHKGDWLGIPATGKAYKFDAVDIFRVQDGKLAEHWDVLDVYSLFKQLGTIN
ncbi:ester cyclase [Hyphomicrobium sp. ghe19]|uniref:ester cyclase n=1 Tax=Hyphomicrobium sp. ghe19 TaxID=2682968 RepID=UPI0013678438|nr:Aklanonic acid methyl ester cyclase DnrD [Hyphomicrobium sp. ghe19]